MSKEVNKERVKKLAEHIAKQVYNLAVDYMPRIENAGSESEKGEAKVTFAASWPAYHHSPSVVTKLSFSTSTKDETESRIDLEQQSMDFGGDEPEPVKPEPLAIEGEVLDAEGWVDAGDRLPDDEVLVEIEDEKGATWKGCFGYDIDLAATAFECEDGEIILVENIVRWRHAEEEKPSEVDPEIVEMAEKVLAEYDAGSEVTPDRLRVKLKTNYDEAMRVYEYLYERGCVDKAGALVKPTEEESAV